MHRRLIALLVVWLAASAIMAEGPAKHPASPEELINLTRLGTVALAPDGTTVLYEAGGLDWPARERQVRHLWIVPSSGGTPRQMTTGEAGEDSPAWAPDSRRFAFLSKRSGSVQLYTMATDGGEATKLGNLTIEPQSSPKWAPDGSAIAFIAVPEPPSEQKARDEKTGNAEVFEEPRDFPQLFTLSYPDGNLKQVTKGEFAIVDFDWAPDGRRFALTTAPTQLLYDTMTSASVRVVDREGTTLATLSPKAGPVQGAPRFSTDGKRVAWRYAPEGLSHLHGLAVCNPDGSGFRNAVAGLDLHVNDFAWVPGSDALFLNTFEGTRGVVRRLDPATGQAPVVWAPPGVVSSLSVDRSGKRIAVDFESTEGPSDPWIVGNDGSAPIRLATLHPEIGTWLLPRTEKMHVATAPGVTVEVLLDHTPLPASGGPVPLLVMPHGGPDWLDQEGFDTWVVYFAGQGYNVLRVNFRGSLGYGFGFYAANRGQIGFVDYDDVMAVVDELVRRGDADPQKLVIGGWSYGGILTAWSICRTDRFKAAMVGAGVSNHVSNYAQSDINHGAAGEWEYLGNPYDDTANYTEASPVYHIRSVTTPVLILHGRDDARVPFPQALELYRALKTTGKSVELVAYPDEGHGIRKPKHAIDRLTRWSAFYDLHLGIARPPASTASARP